MRLLFHQNLSLKLCINLVDLFPDSVQVGRIGLAESDATEVWDAAKEGGFTFVSQDADFADMVFQRGPPPKVIWLRCGNQPTAFIASLLRRRADAITSFETDPEAVCLEIC